MPERTLTSVPAHESCVSQKVPRTDAAAYFPFVVKYPLPFPQRRRTFGFGGAADNLPLWADERA